MKKNKFVRFYHRNAHYYVIISRNTSVPMIGHLELAIGMLTSHASWAWLTKISRFFVMKSDFSQMHPSRSGFDSEQSVFFIMNATSTKSTKLCVTKKRVVNNFLSWDVAMKSEFALWNQLYNFTNSWQSLSHSRLKSFHPPVSQVCALHIDPQAEWLEKEFRWYSA